MHSTTSLTYPVADSSVLAATAPVHGTSAPSIVRLDAATGREFGDVPTFVDPIGLDLSAAYAVVLRDAAGLPIHGGFFGIGRNGIVQLRLTDRKRGIDTDRNPAWAAFGIELAFGARHGLRVQDASGIRLIPWIIDDTAINRLERFNTPSALRADVRRAYVRHVLPAFQHLN
ncbi:hypothetical protein [Burkholderia gladioli]|uniref:hypothetical protein n=1 Tax=Burkholderia gladioli TaxID=28095 RepID=UPI0005C44996|nr:hypothetical protein [Burkholderia gladioli]